MNVFTHILNHDTSEFINYLESTLKKIYSESKEIYMLGLRYRFA